MALQTRALHRTATRFKKLFVAAPKRKADTGDLGQYAADVPLTVRGQYGQTADLVQFTDSSNNLLSRIDKLGLLSGLGVAHATYSFASDAGAAGLITPKLTASIPKGAVIIQAVVSVTAACTGTAGATVAIGTSAGSAANSILTATNISSLTLAAVMVGVPVLATASTWVVMSAAGSITFTVAVHDLTAGVLDAFVFYVMPN